MCIDASDARNLRGAVGRQPAGVIRRGLRPRPPTVVGAVHVELGHDRVRIAFVGDRRIDRLQHEHALAGVCGHADPRVTAAVLGVRERHQRTAAAVAEQHDRVGASLADPRHRSCDVGRGGLVEAVDVVVEVAGGEAEYRVARGREQRAGVVHREVPSRMREHDRGVPRAARRRRPPQAAHEGAVGGNDAHRFPAEVDAGVVFRERPVPKTERALRSGEDVGHGR